MDGQALRILFLGTRRGDGCPSRPGTKVSIKPGINGSCPQAARTKGVVAGPRWARPVVDAGRWVSGGVASQRPSTVSSFTRIVGRVVRAQLAFVAARLRNQWMPAFSHRASVTKSPLSVVVFNRRGLLRGEQPLDFCGFPRSSAQRLVAGGRKGRTAGTRASSSRLTRSSATCPPSPIVGCLLPVATPRSARCRGDVARVLQCARRDRSGCGVSRSACGRISARLHERWPGISGSVNGV
jgi:hypothetical protein